jgi:hypothetical protein
MSTVNALRLQFRALAYNLGNFLNIPATPELINDWSLLSLYEGGRCFREVRIIAAMRPEILVDWANPS